MKITIGDEMHSMQKGSFSCSFNLKLPEIHQFYL